ncbi:hypothetical protein N7535_004922 [Penicillium sp. DV-2018c]|nr:hypothetical protein N7461_008503 [Penicillium sp. DV-2018c]KAJ5571262.1 hypothetical protein N7535_004922 [Penicillium sp. DV-2018c]
MLTVSKGRSPYEAPDNAEGEPSNPLRRVSSIHADDYVQQYDSRGHPVNPASRSLGKDLRRAKNDILSTMGIVVSREDRKSISPDEQRKVNQVEDETDFGLLITTFDQLFVFFGNWWTSSLTSRVQTYKHYAHSALIDAIEFERDTMGILRFHFAGIPAWFFSGGLAMARANPLKRLFISFRDYIQSLAGDSLAVRSLCGFMYTIARHSVLMLSMEFYMYSTLQSLALISPLSIPGIHLLLPFGRESLLQLPQLPPDVSAGSLSTWVVGLLSSPGVLVYLYGYYFRPLVEERTYRLIRRRLPKPILPDELSVRIAYEGNLIEWVVPTLGRRSDEELHRSNLTLLEDIKYELAIFRRWLSSICGLRSTLPDGEDPQFLIPDERIENLRNSIQLLQNELDGVQINLDDEGAPSDPVARPPGVTPDTQLAATAARPRPQDPNQSTHSGGNSFPGLNQVLTNEDRMSQSPGEMSNDYFSGIAAAGLTRSEEDISNIHGPQNQTDHSQNGEPSAMDRQNSRSNTLFSHPSSPGTSPPTSPRVRASLIHQSSDVITMQLELLGNRNRSPQQQASTLARLNALTGNNASGSNAAPDATDRRSIAEFLDALISSQAHREREQEQQQQSQPAADTETLTSVTAGPSAIPSQVVAQHQAPGTQDSNLPTMPSIEEVLDSLVSYNPPVPEEPNHREPADEPVPDTNANHAENEPSEGHVESAIPALSSGEMENTLTPFHRVTLLSTYPMDALASHLAATISSIMLAPLETLYLRSLAGSWVMRHPSSVASSSNLHPLGIWSGGRTWSDMGAYTYRFTLMRGLQVAIRVGVWWLLVGSTMRIGRKFCGWGTL